MADLFPIGLMSAPAVNTGAMDGINYSMLEPNNGTTSKAIYSNLVTTFENQTRLTRKKAQPYLTMSYTYENIFAREFNQIDHFADYVEEGLNSFFVVDWSKGQTPTVNTTGGATWVTEIDNTRLYSAIANQKAYYVFYWNSASWKFGTISSISANTSITVDVDSDNYGGLSDAAGAVVTGSGGVIVYPVYEVYMVPGSISNFKSTAFVPHIDMNTTSDGGWMRSGTMSFVSKYKI